MAKITLSTHVAAPVNRVFEAFADFNQADKTIDTIVRIEMLTDSPVGSGTRFRETRVMFGREATEEMEVTAFETNKFYTVSANSCGSRFDSTFRFSPRDNGTLVEMELLVNAKSMVARLMWPVGKLMMRSMRRMMQADMDQLKAACENGPPVSC